MFLRISAEHGETIELRRIADDEIIDCDSAAEEYADRMFGAEVELPGRMDDGGGCEFYVAYLRDPENPGTVFQSLSYNIKEE